MGVLHLHLERETELVGERAQRAESPARDYDTSYLRSIRVFCKVIKYRDKGMNSTLFDSMNLNYCLAAAAAAAAVIYVPSTCIVGK